eukprot:Phypoly_transcript_03122.p1 GENE.Phypoly_transcript_03122~~Phypoly_transcript_03122.p1  ORF type:complete len:808 (+),score=113.84 Phypoly_transcript_03122:95-2518(+)
MQSLLNIFKKSTVAEKDMDAVLQVPFVPSPSHYDTMHAHQQHKEVNFLPTAPKIKNGLQRTDHPMKLNTAKCFSISEALSPEECKKCIDSAEALGYKSVDWEYSKSYRDCDRVVVKDENLAQIIWQRLKSCLTPDDFRGMRPFGFGNDGNWIPIGINECIRYTRYKPGHKFKPHRDGGFVLTNDVRSVFTVMIYLNDGFSGGETNFFVRTESDFEKQLTLVPKIGTMLVFNHDVWHEGCEVTKDKKYILRTDIMFERIEVSISHQSYLLDPDYIEAARLYNQSIKLQGEGNQEGSTACYLKALDLQAKHATIDFVPQLDHSTNFQVLKLAFVYMEISSIIKIATVCRAWNYMVHDPLVWQKLYSLRWNEKAVMKIDYSITRNWFVTFKSRFIAEKNFQPNKNEILFFDLGAKYTKFGMSKEKENENLHQEKYFLNLDPDTFEFRKHHFHYSHEKKYYTYNGPYQIESVLQQIIGHYWAVDSAIDSFLVGPEVTGKNSSEFMGRKKPTRLYPISLFGTQNREDSNYYSLFSTRGRDYPKMEPPKIEKGDPKMVYAKDGEPKLEIDTKLVSAIFRWCIVTGLVNENPNKPADYWKNPDHFPIIVAEPQGVGSYATFIMRYVCHKLLRCPYVCVVHPAELALMGQGLRSGLVVSSGHFTTQIVPVWEGEILTDKIRFFPVAGFDFEQNHAEAEERCWKKDESIVDLMCQVVASCDQEKQNIFWERVVLSGGGTYNFSDRLAKELKERVSRCKLIIPDDRILDVAQGANVMCHLSNIKERFETNDDFFDEYEKNIIYVPRPKITGKKTEFY